MEPEYYAIDIALIPAIEAFNPAIGLNRQLIERNGDYSIVLGKSSCLPHISLVMCGIRADVLEELKSRLFRALAGYIPYKAEFEGYAVVETSGGVTVSGIDIVKDKNILEIQEIAVDIAGEFMCEKITPDFFSGNGRDISDFSLEYSENYFRDRTGDNFSPHITLGHGDIKEIVRYEEFPGSFNCNRLAVCHLGNQCTCAEILGSLEII